ncbi:leukocyte receptor cluster member 8 homolog isoform X2 [Cryptotermes secundus]|uniref:leukocyte receptor cluster member 8 homolog isoform X2 n=1 Tax=Cryptotermes secundus TaxID=105785 RepID=UPI000CD7B301|nr:leukocyte receptor cluster member 8 homolog isoform X2 [Cryptotermes secundus]
MGDKCQNQLLANPWQYPPPYGIYAPYASQPYGHNGYGHPGQYFYGYSGMGFNPNSPQGLNGPNNQNVPQVQSMNHAMPNKAFPSDFNHQNNACSNNQPDPNDKNSDCNELPPLPPGPPPPLSGHNYAVPTPPGTSPLRPQFYGQTNNTYNPVKFNLANKKTGLGFKPFNNGGGNKKKRKKNKNNQFNNSFNNSMAGNSPVFLHLPPLPPEVSPPPFPPLPPLPQEPAPPAPPSEDPNKDEVTDQAHIMKPMETSTDTPFSVTTKTLEERASAAVSNSQVQQKTLLTPPATSFNPSGDWPEGLKNYVNRCYAKCVENVDKDQVEIILKGKITRAANEGSLWIKNWDKEPLPSCSSSTPQKQQSGGRGKKSGLSAAMGSRLGVRSYRRKSRSRSRSRTRSHSRSPSLSRSRRNRSRSSDSSRSPVRRKRTRSDSSSSSDDNFKPLRVTKNRGGGRVTDRLSLKGRTGNKSKGKGRQNSKGTKSHFYSEFGLNSDELGNSERLQQRAARFSSNLKSSASSASSQTAPQRRKKPLSLVTTIANMGIYEDLCGDIDWSEFHVVGTCQDIEKPYLRLTSAPDASIVRPVEVLKNSIMKVKERWVITQDYRYACDQMKSIRQDLTVQGIRDAFTVEVYETHARIALEKGDHEEFNQCQTQLKMLYSEIGGANRLEFTAYRILYYIFTKNTLDLTTILASLTPEDKTDECVVHALAVRSAWWLGNYHRLFKLYTESPRMAGYLIDWFADRERKAAIKSLIKTYRPFLPLSFVVQELAFDSDEKCLEFITPFGLTFEGNQRTRIDCKASLAAINAM